MKFASSFREGESTLIIWGSVLTLAFLEKKNIKSANSSIIHKFY